MAYGLLVLDIITQKISRDYIIREFIGLWDIEWKHVKIIECGWVFLNHSCFDFVFCFLFKKSLLISKIQTLLQK